MTGSQPDGLPVTACPHCAAAIVLATSTSGGDPLPVDAAPSDHGTVLVQRRADGTLDAGVASPGVARAARRIGRPTYLQHAPSCIDPRAWTPARPRAAGRRR